MFVDLDTVILVPPTVEETIDPKSSAHVCSEFSLITTQRGEPGGCSELKNCSRCEQINDLQPIGGLGVQPTHRRHSEPVETAIHSRLQFVLEEDFVWSAVVVSEDGDDRRAADTSQYKLFSHLLVRSPTISEPGDGVSLKSIGDEAIELEIA